LKKFKFVVARFNSVAAFGGANPRQLDFSSFVMEKAGMSQGAMNFRNGTTGTATEYLNNEVNKKLK